MGLRRSFEDFRHFMRKNGMRFMQSARQHGLEQRRALVATRIRSHKFAAIYQMEIVNEVIIFADLENIVG